MPNDSTLAVEVLARSIKTHSGWIRLEQAFAQPDELWLRDPRGAHYIAEIAIAWAGDYDYWRALVPKNSEREESSE